MVTKAALETALVEYESTGDHKHGGTPSGRDSDCYACSAKACLRDEPARYAPEECMAWFQRFRKGPTGRFCLIQMGYLADGKGSPAYQVGEITTTPGGYNVVSVAKVKENSPSRFDDALIRLTQVHEEV